MAQGTCYTKEQAKASAMAVGIAALATWLLVNSLCWKEAHSQVTNVIRPECSGIFDFYFVLDRYVCSYTLAVVKQLSIENHSFTTFHYLSDRS